MQLPVIYYYIHCYTRMSYLATAWCKSIETFQYSCDLVLYSTSRNPIKNIAYMNIKVGRFRITDDSFQYILTIYGKIYLLVVKRVKCFCNT